MQMAGDLGLLEGERGSFVLLWGLGEEIAMVCKLVGCCGLELEKNLEGFFGFSSFCFFKELRFLNLVIGGRSSISV